MRVNGRTHTRLNTMNEVMHQICGCHWIFGVFPVLYLWNNHRVKWSISFNRCTHSLLLSLSLSFALSRTALMNSQRKIFELLVVDYFIRGFSLYPAFKKNLNEEHNWQAEHMLAFLLPSQKAISFAANHRLSIETGWPWHSPSTWHKLVKECAMRKSRALLSVSRIRENRKVVKPSTFLSWETDFPRKPLLFFSVCAKLFQLCSSVRCWSTQKKKQKRENKRTDWFSSRLFSLFKSSNPYRIHEYVSVPWKKRHFFRYFFSQNLVLKW